MGRCLIGCVLCSLMRFTKTVSEAIRSLKVVTKPVPAPRRGQVLVKVEAAPCNPSDLLFLQARYAQLKTLPAVPGWEGAGTVVASGGGWIARYLQGKRVACSIQGDRDGTWGQYAVANALECIPLKSGLATEQGACLIINPLSAMGLLDTARRAGHQAAVHTAGASQLGRMLLVLGRETNFPLIHVVRRTAQMDLLKSLGGRHVLNLSDEGFAQQLREACHKLNATAAFEALAGDMTGTVLQAMPSGATVYVYGALSEQPCHNINPIALIFEGKSITGFFLANWVDAPRALGRFTGGRSTAADDDSTPHRNARAAIRFARSGDRRPAAIHRTDDRRESADQTPRLG